MTTGCDLIKRERLEQIHKHGFGAEHDEKHQEGSLLGAAAYLLSNTWFGKGRLTGWFPQDWALKYKKKFDAKEDDLEKLVIAGALIAAEIDKMLAMRNDHKVGEVVCNVEIGNLGPDDMLKRVLEAAGYDVAVGTKAVLTMIEKVASEDTQPRCSGFGVFPGGAKCGGCGDCEKDQDLKNS